MTFAKSRPHSILRRPRRLLRRPHRLLRRPHRLLRRPRRLLRRPHSTQFSREFNPNSSPIPPVPRNPKITKEVWDVRHVRVLFAFTSNTPHPKLRILPTPSVTLQDPNKLSIFATAIASTVDGNRPYILLSRRISLSPLADTCAQHLQLLAGIFLLVRTSQWDSSGGVPLLARVDQSIYAYPLSQYWWAC